MVLLLFLMALFGFVVGGDILFFLLYNLHLYNIYSTFAEVIRRSQFAKGCGSPLQFAASTSILLILKHMPAYAEDYSLCNGDSYYINKV